MKLCEEVELEKYPNLGVTILLNERWMFMATLSTPYMVMENGLDLFVDPFSYGGVLNIHIKQHQWPQTAGIDVEDNILDFLPSKQHSEPVVEEEPEPEQPLEEEPDENEEEGEGKDGEGEDDREGEDKD